LIILISQHRVYNLSLLFKFLNKLVYIPRTPIEELDERSCTDLPQQWGKLGQAASKYLHKPVPVGEFCHVFPITSVYDKSLPNDISEDLQQEIRSYFLQSKISNKISNMQWRN